jgi:hypothetical protein
MVNTSQLTRSARLGLAHRRREGREGARSTGPARVRASINAPRQDDRTTGRQDDRTTGRQDDRTTGRQVDRTTGRQDDGSTGRQVDRSTGRQVVRSPGRQVVRSSGRPGHRMRVCEVAYRPVGPGPRRPSGLRAGGPKRSVFDFGNQEPLSGLRSRSPGLRSPTSWTRRLRILSRRPKDPAAGGTPAAGCLGTILVLAPRTSSASEDRAGGARANPARSHTRLAALFLDFRATPGTRRTPRVTTGRSSGRLALLCHLSSRGVS